MFVSDEHANFSENSNFTAMKGGQKNVINPLTFRTTTAYAINASIMEEDLDYIRKVYKDVVADERMFALIYYADKEHIWNDTGLLQANPLRVDENYKTMREDRKKALVQTNLQEEFITKTCNVFTQEKEDEKYLNIDEWKKGSIPKANFEGLEVVVGVDLSITTDLTAVSIMAKKDGKYLLHSKGFLPRETLSKRREKIDYVAYERQGYCDIHDGFDISYTKIEQYIRDIEVVHNCKVKAITSDPYNAKEMMERLAEDYNVIIIKQSYSNLSAPTKAFRSDVYAKRIQYEQNKLLDWCVSNTILMKGKVEDVMVSKANKNKQRIDLLAAAIFAYSQLYLSDKEVDLSKTTNEFLDRMGW